MPATKGWHAYTYGEYLALEADAPTIRHEFVDGAILAMAGGSDLHSALIATVSGELYRELRGTPCGLRESNLRVHVRATGNAFYADALVVCGEAEIVHEIRGGDSLLNPTVIVEVLSPSTEAYDRGPRFDVLVAYDDPAIEVRSRDEAGNWTSREFGAGQKAGLAAIGCLLDVDVVYREARKNLRAKPPVA
jgi:Uma2 family endonuclease